MLWRLTSSSWPATAAPLFKSWKSPQDAQAARRRSRSLHHGGRSVRLARTVAVSLATSAACQAFKQAGSEPSVRSACASWATPRPLRVLPTGPPRSSRRSGRAHALRMRPSRTRRRRTFRRRVAPWWRSLSQGEGPRQPRARFLGPPRTPSRCEASQPVCVCHHAAVADAPGSAAPANSTCTALKAASAQVASQPTAHCSAPTPLRWRHTPSTRRCVPRGYARVRPAPGATLAVVSLARRWARACWECPFRARPPRLRLTRTRAETSAILRVCCPAAAACAGADAADKHDSQQREPQEAHPQAGTRARGAWHVSHGDGRTRV